MFKLQDMRDTKKLKWPIYIGFAIIIISFIFFYGFRPDAGRMQNADYDVARLRTGSINPLESWETISVREAARLRQDVLMEKASQLPPQMQMLLQTNPGIENRLVTDRDLAYAAADKRLIQRHADEMGVDVATRDVVEMLRQQPYMTEERLEAAAMQMGMDKHQFVEMIREDQVESRVRALRTMLAHASLFELWQEYLLFNEKLTFQMAAYPTAEFVDQVVVTEQELQDYLAEHIDEFRVPETRRYAYVKLTREDLRDALEPTSASLHVYYEQHQVDYFEPGARLVEEMYVPLLEDDTTTRAVAAFEALRPRLAASDAWSTLSQELSEEYPDLSFFYRPQPTWIQEGASSRSANYTQRVMALGEDQVSTPIVETSGVYVVRVLEERRQGTPPFEQVEDRVREDYIGDQVEEEFTERFSAWKAEARKHDTIQSFAAAVGREDQLTTAVETNVTVIPGIGQIASTDRDYLLRDLDPGELSDVMQTTDGMVVVQIVDPKPAYDPELAEVREKVEAALRRERAVALARAAAEQALNALEAGAEFDAALADAPVAPFRTDPLTRTQPVRNLGAPLIGLTQATLGVEEGSTGMTPYGYSEDSPVGFAVWQVADLEQPTVEEFDAERAEFERDYLQVQRLTILREWQADLRRQAGFELLDQEGNPVRVAEGGATAAATAEPGAEAEEAAE